MLKVRLKDYLSMLKLRVAALSLFSALMMFIMVGIPDLDLAKISYLAVSGTMAATGTLGIPALIVAALVFIWTRGHFWTLALLIIVMVIDNISF